MLISACSVAHSCLTLCNPMYCSSPGSSVYGIPQARILEWVAISFSRGPSQPRDRTHVSCIPGRILYRLSYQGSPTTRIQQFLKVWSNEKLSQKHPYSYNAQVILPIHLSLKSKMFYDSLRFLLVLFSAFLTFPSPSLTTKQRLTYKYQVEQS